MAWFPCQSARGLAKVIEWRPGVQRTGWVAALVLYFGAVCGSGASAVNDGNPIGTGLQRSFIWTAEPALSNSYVHAVFRREFELPSVPAMAQLHLFAYTRYQLFINGEYVGRGPNRFENKRPEYDTWDIRSRLHFGRNLIAVLVHRDLPDVNVRNFGQSLSRIRRHDPGFAARLDLDPAQGIGDSLVTDTSWRALVETGYSGPAQNSYSSIPDNINAQRSPGDWSALGFDDRTWPQAVRVNTTDLAVWPALSPRTIPLLRETEIPFTAEPVLSSGSHALAAGGEIVLRCRQMVQAYWVLDLEAESGAKLVATPLLPDNRRGPANIYVCRGGPQRWIGGDTFAMNGLSLKLESGRATVTVRRLVEVLYPFERVGSFASSNPALDRIWQLTARSLELLSEDAYTDCADRERSEWMDCDPPMYDASRVMMAGPGEYGARVWSDPRLFANLLRRVALTQERDGMLRARTCSELVDIHTRMEDRACDWVEGLRKYYEATGDQELIRELWPYCERLLRWIANHRTSSGLVKAREWIAWDNPMAYATCEGTANNAFFQRAYADAAWLAAQTGNPEAAVRWGAAARDLYAAFNQLLWDETAGAYASAYGTPEVLPEDRMFKKAITLKQVNGRTEPTLHANLYAIDRGLVPPDRRPRVTAWVIAHEREIKQIMANHFFFKLLYSLDQPQYDQKVLDRIGRGWKGMIESPWQTTWEGMGGGSKVHCYGIVPGYTLSTYVLGVRRDAPVREKQIIIEPHLADLTRAEGTVVTEFGPVPVSWKRQGTELAFRFEVPPGSTATLRLPDAAGTALTLDGRRTDASVQGRRATVTVAAGVHEGRIAVTSVPAPAPDTDVIESRLSAELAPLVIAAKTTDTSPTALESEVVKQGLIPLASVTDSGAAHDGGSAAPGALFNGTTCNGVDGAETLNDGKTFRGYGRASSLSLQFDISQHPAGYNLTQLLTFAGHQDARASQNYTVSLAFATEPTKFIKLGSASFSCSGGASELRFMAKDGGVLDNGSGCRASGVVGVRFEFQDGPLGFNVYREISLVGQPKRE